MKKLPRIKIKHEDSAHPGLWTHLSLLITIDLVCGEKINIANSISVQALG